MDRKCTVIIDGNVVQIDPQLLFQRLTLAAKSAHDVKVVFKYELCSYPPALFESLFLLREAQKPVLADAMWVLLQSTDIVGVNGVVQYMLYGGALLQHIPWKKGATYDEILSMYAEYVTKKYGQAIVLFDGYLNSSIKDTTHQRCLKSKLGATISFTENMHLTMTRREFLTNKVNKQRFVNMLGEALEKRSCRSCYASADADSPIVHKTIESAANTDTILLVMIQVCLSYCVIMQAWIHVAYISDQKQEEILSVVEFGIYSLLKSS